MDGSDEGRKSSNGRMSNEVKEHRSSIDNPFGPPRKLSSAWLQSDMADGSVTASP